MSLEERCPKFPSLLKKYCSHCQGTARGTPDNPIFTLREHTYLGWPVVEVLKDGGSIHSYDSNFRFGIRKAQMILVCMDILKEFWQAGDDAKLTFKPRIIKDTTFGLTLQAFVEMHPEFETSTGRLVDRPWLRLQSMFDKEHIGLGGLKCKALYAVRQELADWLKRHGAIGNKQTTA